MEPDQTLEREDVLTMLGACPERVRDYVMGLDESRLAYRHGPAFPTLGELVLHVSETGSAAGPRPPPPSLAGAPPGHPPAALPPAWPPPRRPPPGQPGSRCTRPSKSRRRPWRSSPTWAASAAAPWTC